MSGGKNRQPSPQNVQESKPFIKNGPRGYTILEVMIFLAISGFMFVLAASFINGKQAAVEFKQGMHSVDTKIQDMVNQVVNGEFPSLGDFTCKVPNAKTAASLPTFTSVTKTTQGGNGGTLLTGTGTTGCIFLGQVIQFAPDGKDNLYNVYTVAARQADINGTSVSSALTAQAVVVDNTPGAGSVNGIVYDPDAPAGINLTSQHQLEGTLGLTAAYLCPKDNPCSPISGFGVINTFPTADVDPNDPIPPTLFSGSQSIMVVTLPANKPGQPFTTLPANEKNMVQNINTNLGQTPSHPLQALSDNSHILLCFQGPSRKGAVTIGGSSGQQFTTTVNTGGSPAECP